MSEEGRLYAYNYGRVPDELLFSKASDRACRLYAVLTRYAQDRDRAFPGRKRLAGDLDCSVATLDRAIQDLRESGFLLVKERKREDGGRSTNDYILTETPSSPMRRGVLTGDEGPSSPVSRPYEVEEGSTFPSLTVVATHPSLRSITNKGEGKAPRSGKPPRTPRSPDDPYIRERIDKIRAEQDPGAAAAYERAVVQRWNEANRADQVRRFEVELEEALAAEPATFTCPTCETTTTHPSDAAEGYCRSCRRFTRPLEAQA